MHLKRISSPKTWPIPRKGTKYLVVPSEKGIPLIVMIRDVMKFAQNKKEIKRMLHEGMVTVNGLLVKEISYALKLFDILKLKKQCYRITIKNKKFMPEEISEKEAGTKIAKVIGRKILKGKKVQINLDDGRNYLVKDNFKIGDSALIDFKSGIKKIIPLKEKTKIMVKSGKHMGKQGVIEKIGEQLAEIKLDGEKINVNLESLIALE